MTNVSYLYSLLLTDDRPHVSSQLMTRSAAVDVDEGTVLVAVDSQGLRHILVPIGSQSILEDHRSSGVTLGVRRLSTKAGDMRYADLACNVTRLGSTFEQLVHDLIGRLQVAQLKPVDTVHQVLDDWRSLLRQALTDVSREVVLGLVGELEILKALAAHSPLAALEAWTGPTGTIHDFARGGTHAEIKATASVSAGSVRISNLDQLDPSLADDLWLAVVHVAENEKAPSIEDRLNELAELGIPYGELSARVVQAGYVPGSETAVSSRYEVRAIRWWRIDDAFPSLYGSQLRPEVRAAIDRVQYDLVLAALADPKGADDVESHIASWMS